MSRKKPLRLFLDSNVLTGGILSDWGLDKAVLSLCAARICRMVLAEYVREEVEDNLLTRAAAFSPEEAESDGVLALDWAGRYRNGGMKTSLQLGFEVVSNYNIAPHTLVSPTHCSPTMALSTVL